MVLSSALNAVLPHGIFQNLIGLPLPELPPVLHAARRVVAAAPPANPMNPRRVKAAPVDCDVMSGFLSVRRRLCRHVYSSLNKTFESLTHRETRKTFEIPSRKVSLAGTTNDVNEQVAEISVRLVTIGARVGSAVHRSFVKSQRNFCAGFVRFLPGGPNCRRRGYVRKATTAMPRSPFSGPTTARRLRPGG